MSTPWPVRTGPQATSVGPYRLERLLGEGGMGVVHLAYDAAGNPVAVKVLRPHVAVDRDGRRRLSREVATMRRVRGPHVAQVLDADVDCDLPYLVTRYVPGEPLDRLVARSGPLPLQALVGLGAGLADALDCMHAAGVVHRDLKPANVLVDAGRPVVIDFGIAQLVDDVQLTMTGSFFGTPGYLAPEVVRGERASSAADIASWAATMTFAATGRPPYGSGPVEVVLGRISAGLIDLAGAPTPLIPVLRAALAPVPQRPTAGQLRGWIEQLADRTPGTRLLTEQHGGPSPGSTYLLTRPVPPVPRPATAPQRGPEPAPARVPQQTSIPPPAPAPWHATEPYQPPWQRRAARLGGALLAAAILATMVGVFAIAPYVGASLAAATLLIAQAGTRSARLVERRRLDRGRRRSDGFAVAGALPWHLVRSALSTVGALGTGMLGAGAGAALGLPFAAGAGVELLAVSAGAGAMIACWFGPGHARHREATRRLSACLRPTGTTAAVAVFALAAAVTLTVALRSPVDWFPLSEPGPLVRAVALLSRLRG